MRVQKRIQKQRQRRVYRVRNQIRRAKRLRLSVFRSNRHIYAQIIDDSAGRTLVSASSLESDVAGPGSYAGNRESASKVGTRLADRAKEHGITAVAFDRGPYKYHGRVAALADAARQGGLEF